MNSAVDAQPNLVRRRVLISGRVQGVGYRESCKREARAAEVSGWVENRHDGTVIATFEGARVDVEHMVEWCRVGPSSARVSSVYVADEQTLGEWEDFFIRN